MPRQHIIYKTTNLINGKFYIGKHSCDHLKPYYLGSGNAIRDAIKKYGRKNFIRETLFIFDNEDDCIQKEMDVVTEELTQDPLCYNISTGGYAGRTQADSSKKLIANAVKEEWHNNTDRKNAASLGLIERNAAGISGLHSWSDESRKIMSAKAKERWSNSSYKKNTGAAISKALTGVKQSESHLQSNIRAQNKTKYCKHCQQPHKIAAYGRWHGDKCKENN